MSSRLETVIVTLIGMGFVVTGTLVAVLDPSGRSTGSSVTFVLTLFALIGLGLALWKVSGSQDEDDTVSVPWADNETFANPAPERTATSYPFSSGELSAVVKEAGEVARQYDIEDGIETVRPELRSVLIESMVMGGRSQATAEELLATGEWTDDQLAASVLDDAIDPPEQGFRDRTRSWLHPEWAVRRRVAHAVQAIDECADAGIASIPGQQAPRSVPIIEPRLEDLHVSADGTLQEAVNPNATARGPQPIEPTVEIPDDSDEMGTETPRTDDERSETHREEIS